MQNSDSIIRRTQQVASQNSHALTRGQLAFFDTDIILGLGQFKKEAEALHKFKHLSLQEIGCHCKCYAVFFGVLALLAAAGGTWVLVGHIQHHMFISSLLGGVALVSLAAVVVRLLLSARKQQMLATELNQFDNEEIPIETVREHMEERDVDANSIQAVVNHLEGSSRVELVAHIRAVYLSPNREKPLTDAEKKVFYSVLRDPSSYSQICDTINNGLLALLILSRLDEECPGFFLAFLLQTIGALHNVKWEGSGNSVHKGCAILAKFPGALQDYINTLGEKNQVTYAGFFLIFVTSDTPLGLILYCLNLISNPNSEERACLCSRHPQAVIARAQNDRKFALAMVQYLPSDKDVPLLLQLFQSIGAPHTREGAEILERHPEILKMVAGSADALSYCKFLLDKVTPDIRLPREAPQIAALAQDPLALARLAIGRATWFTPEGVYLIFQEMSESNQISFLNALEQQTISDPSTSTKGNAVVQYILQNHLTSEFVDKFRYIIDPRGIASGYCKLLQAFGKWPTLLAKRLFTEDEASESLISKPHFLNLCFQQLSPDNQQICAEHVAQSFATNASRILSSSLSNDEYWINQIMRCSPDLLAQILCSTEIGDSQQAQREALVNSMSPENQKVFRLKYIEYFKDCYEKHVFADTPNNRSYWTKGLIKSMHYLHAHPEWVEKNPQGAQRYLELFINAEISENGLMNTLLCRHPSLVKMYEMVFKNFTVEVPLYRLLTLSSYFEKLLKMLQSNQKNRICLQEDVGVDVDVSTAQTFLHYLSTGDVECTGENVLALSQLAHKYELWQLAAQCTTWIQEEVLLTLDFHDDNDVQSFNRILDAAISWDLWDLRCACLVFIMQKGELEPLKELLKQSETKQRRRFKFKEDARAEEYANFVALCIKCMSGCKISMSYTPKQKIVCHSSVFGDFLYYSQNLRLPRISDGSRLPEFACIQAVEAFCRPIRWHVLSLVAARLCCKAYQEKKFDQSIKWLNHLNHLHHHHREAEKTWTVEGGLTCKELCQLYVLALSQQNTQELAKDILKFIQETYTGERGVREVKTLLEFKNIQGELALTRISHTFSGQIAALPIEIASQVGEDSVHATRPRPLERQDHRAECASCQRKCEKCGLSILSLKIIIDNPDNAKIKTILMDPLFSSEESIQLGKECTKAKISFDYPEPSNYHVYIKDTITEETIKIIQRLNQLQEITHLHVPKSCTQKIKDDINQVLPTVEII
jgi:hypothetical protein